MAPESINKGPPIRPPQVTLNMTNQQFRKFKIDWDVFKKITTIPPPQIAAQLYSLCDDSVQTNIINNNADFFNLNETDMIKTIETIVTQ